MFSATRRWLRRNRTPLAIGLGVVGAGYVVTQFVLSKINDARERMSSDRIAKENLRRRFEQNQEDCTFTVLALLPTMSTNILEAMNTERITYEIQQMKSTGSARSLKSASIAETTLTEDDGRSMVSMQSESGVHASQVTLPSPAAAPAAAAEEGAQEGEAAAPAATPAIAPAPAPAPVPVQKRKTKRQLWDELTISSITRAYTLLYTVGLLIMLTRVQLNLLGRRSYLSSVVSLATGAAAQATISLENNDDDNPEPSLGNDFEVNRKYLAFSWWLLNRSWADVAQRVEAAVREAFGHLSPRDHLSRETFAELTRRVRRLVEERPDGSSPTNWLPFVLPPPDMEDFVLRESGILGDSASAAAGAESVATPPPSSPTSTASLRRLLDETSDLVEAPTFSHVLTQLLDAGFSTLLDKKLAPDAFDQLPPPPQPAALIAAEREASLELSRYTGGSSVISASSGSGVGAGAGKTVQLPKVLSVLTRQAHVIGNGMPNEYVEAMEAVRDLEAFAAVVYSSNWESEMRGDGLMASAVHVPPAPSQTRAEASSAEGGEKAAATREAEAAAAAVDAEGASTVLVPPGGGEESGSIVMLDQSSTFESAWEKALQEQK